MQKKHIMITSDPFLARSRHEIVNTLLVVSCFTVTLIVFAPSNIYLTNRAEFLLCFSDLLVITISLAGFSILTIAATLLFLKEILRTKAVSLLLVLTLLLWLQGNILVWQYGPLDGSTIDWHAKWIYGVADGSIWLSAIILTVISPSFLSRFARRIVIALILVQTLSVTITAINTQENVHTSKWYTADDSSKFAFSKNTNVIVIILDEFQSNIFQKIIDQDKSYASIFEGFTYFRNAVSGSSFTELAIPAILTGRLYNNSTPRRDFLREAYLFSSIPKTLKDNDFDVHLFPWLGFANESIHLDEKIATNLMRRSIRFRTKFDEVMRLIDLGLFRSVPHYAKKYVYNKYEWPPSGLAVKVSRGLRENIFFENQSNGRKTGEGVPEFEEFVDKRFVNSAFLNAEFDVEKNVFKFYHLEGMHVPLRIKNDFKVRGTLSYNEENYTAQAKLCLILCRDFFDILKKNNGYDNSLIFIVGDHGSGRSEDMYVEAVYDNKNEELNRKSSRNFQKDKAKGIPLILVKRFNSRERMKISDAAVSVIDIPKTIMTELGMNWTFSGVSMFDENIDDKRKRYYGAFRYRKKRSEFVEPITMYVVSGFSWENDSWDVVGVLPPKSP